MYATLALALTVAFAAPTGASLGTSMGTTRTLSAGDIRQTVQTELARRLDARGSRARIERIDGVVDQVLPVGTMSTQIGDIAGRWPRARVGVPVRLLIDGRVVRTVTAWVMFSEVRPALTYARDVAAKSSIDAASFVRLDVDMTCCDGVNVVDVAELDGKRLRRAVQAGRPVLASDFEPMPDVAARQRVSIEVVRGAVRLTTVGTALGDAQVGQAVTVRPDAAEQAIVARVTDKQKVILDEQTP